jgi:hypothetical protein
MLPEGNTSRKQSQPASGTQHALPLNKQEAAGAWVLSIAERHSAESILQHAHHVMHDIASVAR